MYGRKEGSVTKTIKINGTDYTSMFTRYGYTVGYRKVLGPNGGRTLDSTEYEDLVALKAEITLLFMPEKESDLETLLTALYGSDYAELYYFDPRAGTYRTVPVIVGETDHRHTMKSVDGNEYWTCGTITLRER